MAVVNVTLDSIIRHNLAMRKAPLHYYVPTLLYAKQGLQEMHFDSLQKLKIAVLTLDPDLMTATLPTDFVEEVVVGIEIGDKVRSIGYSDQINKRDDDDVPFTQEASVYSLGSGYQLGNTIIENVYNEYLGTRGRNFGRPVTFVDSYTIMRDLGQIRVDNQSSATAIHLTYLALPEKVSNKSVIHPFAQRALHSYINWQWAIFVSDRNQELRRRDFHNDYRILRGRLNKMTTTEIKRVVRNKFGLAIKN
jgi:hypothetical protein